MTTVNRSLAFFHADLHPGNLVILPSPRAGFVDLGMVGRFNEELRRTLLYYYCLVMGDAENAARHLAAGSVRRRLSFPQCSLKGKDPWPEGSQIP